MTSKKSKFYLLVLVSILALLTAFSVSAQTNTCATTWAGSGIGTTTVLADGSTGTAIFNYQASNIGYSTKTWTFKTIATKTETVTISYNYTGHHAWFQVTAFLTAFVNGNNTSLYNAGPANCCTTPSNGFSTAGTISFDVQAGDSYGFRFGGKNFDYNNFLKGTLTLGVPFCAEESHSDGAKSETIEQPHCPVFFDGRINHCDTGNPVVLYGHPYEDEGMGLDVYYADTSGLAISYSAEMIDSVPACPAEDSLIGHDANSSISLWRLPDRGNGVCPFLLVAPTGEANKWYVLIFDDLYVNSYYVSYEETLS